MIIMDLRSFADNKYQLNRVAYSYSSGIRHVLSSFYLMPSWARAIMSRREMRLQAASIWLSPRNTAALTTYRTKKR